MCSKVLNGHIILTDTSITTILAPEMTYTPHFYIDLVFYNYLARCFVLIDLKSGELTHQDLGQMQMYVNYYTRELMNPGDNPPVGIVLCAEKNDAVVRYTLPEDEKQVFAAQYMTYLPTQEELQTLLQEV